MAEQERKIFWLDGWEGKAEGGYFIRNDLFKFLARLQESNRTPVGIAIDDSWNLEVIVEAAEKRGEEKK